MKTHFNDETGKFETTFTQEEWNQISGEWAEILQTKKDLQKVLSRKIQENSNLKGIICQKTEYIDALEASYAKYIDDLNARIAEQTKQIAKQKEVIQDIEILESWLATVSNLIDKYEEKKRADRDTIADLSEKRANAYEEGGKDAWDFAKSLFNMSEDELDAIFDEAYPDDVIYNFSFDEAMKAHALWRADCAKKQEEMARDAAMHNEEETLRHALDDVITRYIQNIHELGGTVQSIKIDYYPTKNDDGEAETK